MNRRVLVKCIGLLMAFCAWLPSQEVSRAGGMRKAMTIAEGSGALFVSVDCVCAIAAEDVARVMRVLQIRRARGLRDWLRAAYECISEDGVAGDVERRCLGMLAVAAILAGNSNTDIGEGVFADAVLREVERVVQAKISVPEFLSRDRAEVDFSRARPRGVYLDSPELASWWRARAYLCEFMAADEPEVEAMWGKYLMDQRLAGESENIDLCNAWAAAMYGRPVIGGWGSVVGRLVPVFAGRDNIWGGTWAVLEDGGLRSLGEVGGADFSGLWLGRVLSAEASELLGWPASPLAPGAANAEPSCIRDWLVRACIQVARKQPGESQIVGEDTQVWAQRRLMAALTLYVALRSWDAVDLPVGPITGAERRSLAPRVFIERVPGLYEALANAYQGLEFLCCSAGVKWDGLGSAQLWRRCAEGGGGEVEDPMLRAALLSASRGLGGVDEPLGPWMSLSDVGEIGGAYLVGCQRVLNSGSDLSVGVCVGGMQWRLHGVASPLSVGMKYEDGKH